MSLMTFPPSYYRDEHTPSEEREQEARQAEEESALDQLQALRRDWLHNHVGEPMPLGPFEPTIVEPTSVYLVYCSWPYEGGKVYGVYSTEEKAQAIADDLNRETYSDDAEVKALTLDGPPTQCFYI